MVAAVVTVAARAAVQASVAAVYPAAIVEATTFAWESSAPATPTSPGWFAICCQEDHSLFSWDESPFEFGSFSDVSTVLAAAALVLQ